MPSNKETLRALLITLELNHAQCAAAISEITRRPLSERAIRAWVAGPEKSSSRSCPDWAIDALVEFKNRRALVTPELSAAVRNKSTGKPTQTADWPADFPYTFEELDAALVASMESRKKPKIKDVKYECHRCGMRVTAKPDLWIICGECQCALDE